MAKNTTKKQTKLQVKNVAKPIKKVTERSNKVEADTKTTEAKVALEKKQMKKFPYIKASIAIVAIATIFAAVYFLKDEVIVATVNGEPITRLELVQTMESNFGKNTLEGLVSKRLVEQEATKKGVTVTQQDIENEIAKLKQQTLVQGYEWETALSNQGLTEEILKDQLKYQLYVQKLLADELNVKDEEVAKYIEENAEYFKDQEMTDELKAQIKSSLESQKSGAVVEPWLTKLKGQSKVLYNKEF